MGAGKKVGAVRDRRNGVATSVAEVVLENSTTAKGKIGRAMRVSKADTGQVQQAVRGGL